MVRLMQVAVLAAAISGLHSPSWAQSTSPQLRQFNIPPLSVGQHEMVFCINTASILAEFDRDVAEAVADILLVDPVFYDVEYRDQTWPLDYAIPITEPEFATVLLSSCQAFAGYPYPEQDGIPEWLTISRPYFSSSFVLMVRDPDIAPLEQLPPDAVIGSRLAAPETELLRLRIAGSSVRWLPFTNNESLLHALEDGGIDAALVWQPAVRSLETDLVEAGNPLPQVHQEFAFALPSNLTYLRTQLDVAIQSLQDSGTLDEILAGHGLR